ncbi:MAG: hypothetical protein H7837_11365 [Magnetococcus sp. MYC-9]
MTDLQTLVQRMLRADEAVIGRDDVEDALHLAALRYSEHRPRILVAEVDAPEGVILSLPAEWEVGFSRLTGAEREDVASTEVLDITRIQAEETANGWRLRMASPIPAGLLRLRFAVSHTVTADINTLPEREWEAVATYAAAHLLEQLAVAKSGDTDPSFGGAAVNRSTPAQAYADRAKTLRQHYQTLLGIVPGHTAPAGTAVYLGSARGQRLTVLGDAS